MEASSDELRDRYSDLTDEELIRIWTEGELTAIAKPLLAAELEKRGIPPETAFLQAEPVPREIDILKVQAETGVWNLAFRIVNTVLYLLVLLIGYSVYEGITDEWDTDFLLGALAVFIPTLIVRLGMGIWVNRRYGVSD